MRILSLILTLCFTNYLYAGWLLDSKESSIHFASTKKASITEVHHFKKLSGELDDQGNLQLLIDLSSVETNIGIRNKRMKKYLFEVTDFANATITADVSNALTSLKKHAHTVQDVTATLDLHGTTKQLKTQVTLAKAANGDIVASTTAPILLKAEDFDLLEGVNKLKELAKLDTITPVIPVTLNLTFTQE